jgi:hypothetical protein
MSPEITHQTNGKNSKRAEDTHTPISAVISSTVEQMGAKAVVDETAVDVEAILEETAMDKTTLTNNAMWLLLTVHRLKLSDMMHLPLPLRLNPRHLVVVARVADALALAEPIDW